ncbi:large subunit ribosomal protein L4 [Friedmanniella endophytica]|uniref:Large ribosomal subunit protein uL4 n=1 Tax=Microlunatus kandeliicorticis TaxID=1759536 RepID=A0A7W3P4N4_9ACTN|nr:50S ribosomal protein L4 [Microlunatus kandeliicorticis]MBA8793096.1 large subunit ribosomal protein L4 [Microlunatus kandeliicorticis]
MTTTSNETRTVDVLDAQGAKSGSAELPAELFDVTANIPLIHQVVTAQLAAARQGTHSTKTRGDVRGGGTKPYRQKGTGRARQGSIRAPHYTGGGIVGGPQPHGYAQRTPKKMIAAALRGALSDRARDGRVRVVSELVAGETPSTKAALAALGAVTTATKLLVVLARDEDVAWLSLRNAPTVHVLIADQLNAYDVLCADEVVFTSAALEAFVSGRGASGAATGSTGSGAKPKAMPTLGADGGYRGDEPPAGFEIKGNEDSMKFHAPSSPWYGSTKAEVWFDTAEAAEAAGFTNAEHAHDDEKGEDDK